MSKLIGKLYKVTRHKGVKNSAASNFQNDVIVILVINNQMTFFVENVIKNSDVINFMIECYYKGFM